MGVKAALGAIHVVDVVVLAARKVCIALRTQPANKKPKGVRQVTLSLIRSCCRAVVLWRSHKPSLSHPRRLSNVNLKTVHPRNLSNPRPSGVSSGRA